MSRVLATIDVLDKQWVLYKMCVCSLRYPACNAHAPCYIAVCGFCSPAIFFLIISQTALFSGGKAIETKGLCVFGFPYNFLSEIFLILRKKKLSEMWSQMYRGLHIKCPLLLSGFNEILNFLDRISKYAVYVRFHKNPSSGSRDAACGRGRVGGGRDRQMDGHDEAKCRF